MRITPRNAKESIRVRSVVRGQFFLQPDRAGQRVRPAGKFAGTAAVTGRVGQTGDGSFLSGRWQPFFSRPYAKRRMVLLENQAILGPNYNLRKSTSRNSQS